ncbi:MAG: AMP-binding protein, partial [Candidatus Sulfotelmatobacter sp.]
HWGTVLDAILDDPNRSPEHIPLDSTKRSIARQRRFQQKEASAPFSSLLERVRQRAQNTPAQTVLFSQEDREWIGVTASELYETALAVAHDLGDCTTQLVGMVPGRVSADVAAILGIHAAGGAFIPIDPELPSDRIRFLLADSGIKCVVGAAKLLDRAEFAGLLRVSSQRRKPAAYDVCFPQPERVAYALYTSGTTGNPKAVIVTHGAIEHLHNAMRSAVYNGIPGLRKFAIHAPFSFDASLQHLMVLGDPGTQVYITPRQVQREPAKMIEFLSEHGVNAFDCTPTTARLLLEAGLLAKLREDNPLRLTLVGGERIDKDLWITLANAPVAAFNVYGPTECTVNSTCAAILADRPPHLGHPLGGIGVWVVGEDGQPVPPGVVGELWISGSQVGAGYLNRPDLSKRVFTSGPAWLGASERVFRTGDRARFGVDGRIIFEGRRDGQVKVNGVRIELEAIETVLLRQPDVRDAAVGLWTSDQEVSPVAFVVAHNPIDVAALRRALLNAIPRWEMPQRFVHLDRIPRLTSGKADRKALNALAASAPGPSVTCSSFQTATEEKLGKIWLELLGCVSRNDNFFSLGGNSLLALRMLHRIRTEMDIALPLNAIFASATLADLASTIEKLGQTKPSTSTVVSLHGGGGPTAVLLHPLGGDIFAYRELTKAITSLDVPCQVLGVRSRALSNGRPEVNSIPEMIEGYTEDLKNILSDSPLILVGWSLGGLIALSVGKQLEQIKKRVVSIEVWDCSFSSTTLGTAADPVQLGLRVAFGRHIETILAKSGVRTLEQFLCRFEDVDPESRIPAVMEWAQEHGIPAGATADEIDEHTALSVHHARLFQSWQPEKIRAPIHAVYSDHSLANEFVVRTNWGAYTSGHTCETVVQGTHYSIMREPRVWQTANTLLKSLRELALR